MTGNKITVVLKGEEKALNHRYIKGVPVNSSFKEKMMN
jgi:hypothetical protein